MLPRSAGQCSSARMPPEQSSPRGPLFQGDRWSSPSAWAAAARPCTGRRCVQIGECDGQLLQGGRCAGLIEVHEVIGGEAEHVREVSTAAPRLQEVLDAGERIAPALQFGDQLETPNMPVAVDPGAASSLGGRQDADGLIIPDGATRGAGLGGKLVDAQLVQRHRNRARSHV